MSVAVMREVPYFELHITVEAQSIGVEEIVMRALLDSDGQTWKFSKIDGDPILGAGTKMYATAHFDRHHKRAHVYEELDFIAEMLTLVGLNVVRKKIEMVVFDELVTKG